MGVHVCQNIPTNKECRFYCCPTIHPGQIDENKTMYACRLWGELIQDFEVPVKCGGVIKKCEVAKNKVPRKYLTYKINGLKRRVNNATIKIEGYRREIDELENLIVEE